MKNGRGEGCSRWKVRRCTQQHACVQWPSAFHGARDAMVAGTVRVRMRSVGTWGRNGEKRRKGECDERMRRRKRKKKRARTVNPKENERRKERKNEESDEEKEEEDVDDDKEDEEKKNREEKKKGASDGE